MLWVASIQSSISVIPVANGFSDCSSMRLGSWGKRLSHSIRCGFDKRSDFDKGGFSSRPDLCSQFYRVRGLSALNLARGY